MTTSIHLSGPADVLVALPYQLGYHPSDCLVALSLHGTSVGLVQRLDLPPRQYIGDAVAAMIGPLRQDRPKSVLLIGFEEREDESAAMLDAMASACRAHGVRVANRMVVRGGRWFDPDCHLSCCPPEGLPLPDPSEVPAVAEFVGRGICPMPNRAALADQLEISWPLLSRAVSALAGEWLALRLEATDPRENEPDARETELHACRVTELGVWSRVLSDGEDAEPIHAMPPQDLAMLAVSLTDVDLRDALIAWLCPGTLPQDLIDPSLFVQMSRTLLKPVWLDQMVGEVERVVRLQWIERRLCELCAALPDEWAVSALTVFANFTWWRGDGALTRIALDRALRIDPQYRLALLLEQMVDNAIRPERESA